MLGFILFSGFISVANNLPIDDFEADNYFISQLSGSVNIQSESIDNANYTEGNGAFKVELTNISAGSRTAILRNFGTQIQDWSYLSDSLSFWLDYDNQTGFNPPHFEVSIRIWEDINLNGSFDGSDEVYTSNIIEISGGWNRYGFDLNQFTKVTGNGDNSLNLNRVRAYDIVIGFTGNFEGEAHFTFDQLELVHQGETPSYEGEVMNSTFIQLWNDIGCSCGQWSQQQWEAEMNTMLEACTEEIVVQYGIYENVSWYSPTNLSGIQFQFTTLNKMFAAAENTGMKIRVGLYFDEYWNTADKSLTNTYNNLYAKHTAVIDEIQGLFGSNSAFSGWYIPQEINDLEWQTTNKQSLLFNWLNDVSNYAKSVNNNTDVMIAPFFNLWVPADVIQTWYDGLLNTAPNIAIIAPQDGVGIKLKQTDYHIPLYFSAIHSACEQNNRTFAATIESFEQTAGWPIDNGTFAAQPTSIISLHNQISAALRNGAEQLYQFSWGYMQPSVSNQTALLYSDYKNGSACIPTEIREVASTASFQQEGNSIRFFETQSEVLLHSIEGKLIQSWNSVTRIELSGLKVGLYIIQTPIATKKIVIR
jgi:hypothetical protein